MNLLITGSKDFRYEKVFSEAMIKLIAKWQYDNNGESLDNLLLFCDVRDSILEIFQKFCSENKLKSKVFPYEWREYLLDYVEDGGECSLVVFKTKEASDTNGIVNSCKKRDIPTIVFTV